MIVGGNYLEFLGSANLHFLRGLLLVLKLQFIILSKTFLLQTYKLVRKQGCKEIATKMLCSLCIHILIAFKKCICQNYAVVMVT